MAFRVRPVESFHVTVRDRPEAAYELLSVLAEQGLNLLAFTAIPHDADHTQLTLFPGEGAHLQRIAAEARIEIDGPSHALLVQGDDELGALAGIHEKLSNAGVGVFSSAGISDGRGSYGYLIHVREEAFDRAVRALRD
jgi:hypothetical protein